MATRPQSAPRLSKGAGTCLSGALAFAWYRGSAVVGTHQLLLALIARGDPISSRVLAESGVTYRAVCDVLEAAGQWEDGGIGTAESAAARTLAEAAKGFRPPGRLARLLGTYGSPSRRPLPPWSRNIETVIDEAFFSAQAAGRDAPCRADLTVAWLSQDNGAAADVLERLGADREWLRNRLAEAFAPQGPAPTSATDSEIRPSGWVLGYLLRQGTCSLPGTYDSTPWRGGLTAIMLEKLLQVSADLEVAELRPEHVLLAIIATYEDLAADREQFGPGWEACFPAGRALASYGITYERARQMTLALSPETKTSGPDDQRGFVQRARELFLFTPTMKDGVDEAVRLLGHRPRGKGAMATPEVNLLGVMHEENELANRILAGFHVDRERLRHDLIDALR
ncbi:Clp protease N-terminal domain-containing protein [Actinoallomurus iriomotensis]|uniref:Uncharacterized protein n=1 Tax=Actinoallomurus iriomotensis TaxID=478107 RepID=A0A9W6RF14_9ACTN|nr:Clp protease N-terminal domain-containing protein [Actinoallomurus iriomotensis]GLY74644.1 hypothetical protein Airi01_029110 [Actinoallomurus iriomotensis]